MELSFLSSGTAFMEIAPHVNVDPAICGGTPVITGTRVHVAIVVGSLAGEMTMEEVMEAYELTREQIKGALAYAADLVNLTDAYPIGA
jgi:uncharacterized protein (DUF433 family)/predicted nuclease of predicted toxin-antitoxin system